jgi:glucose-1-phosphate thymidylyltransferase
MDTPVLVLATAADPYTGDAPPIASTGGLPELLPVGNRPILERALARLAQDGLREAAIAAPRASLAPLRAAFGDGSALGIRITYIGHDDGCGPGSAVLAAREFLRGRRFLLHPSLGLPLEDATAGLLAHPEAVTAAAITPPPGESGPSLIGPEVVDALAALTPSWRGDAEPSEAFAAVAAQGGVVARHRPEAWWQYDGTPRGLLAGNRRVLDRLPAAADVPWTGQEQVEGRVQIDPTAELADCIVRGPVVIGARARVSDAYIGPYTSVGAEVRVDAAEIEGSILMTGSSVEHLPSRLAGCVVGPHARVSRSFELPRGTRMWVGAGSEVALS